MAFHRRPLITLTGCARRPSGHFVNVMTNGYGTMYSYASRIEPRDRWAIAAYIRALQLSQQAKVSDLSDEDRRQLQSQPGPAIAGGTETK